MTDSGGVQEEALHDKPVLVLRDETERPEGVKAGTLKLVGTDPKVVTQAMETLLTDEKLIDKMADAKPIRGWSCVRANSKSHRRSSTTIVRLNDGNRV